MAKKINPPTPTKKNQKPKANVAIKPEGRATAAAVVKASTVPEVKVAPAPIAKVASPPMAKTAAAAPEAKVAASPEVKVATAPVGQVVEPLPPGLLPDGRSLYGRWVSLEPVALHHGEALYEGVSKDDPLGQIWTYLAYGPFASGMAFNRWLAEKAAEKDPRFYSFVRRSDNKPLGMGAFMRGDASNGVIEIGHIWMTPELQRSREATEAIYLMMRHAFDELGMRRLEWKCDSLNAPSRQAALRFGFEFEGIFHQHMIIKGRNRDTAWFALLNRDWPAVRQAFESWLSDDNFNGDGQQKAALQARRQTAIQQPKTATKT